MNKKHFADLAEAISKIRDEEARWQAAFAVAQVCKKHNQLFNEHRFFVACGVSEMLFSHWLDPV